MRDSFRREFSRRESSRRESSCWEFSTRESSRGEADTEHFSPRENSRREESRGDSSRTVPTTGMRGGLGRTLLTAFLILTIVPLSLIEWYAVDQNRRNIQKEVENKLEAVVTLKGEALRQWFLNFEMLFCFFPALERGSPSDSGAETFPSDVALMRWWERFREQVPEAIGVELLGQEDEVLWTTGTCNSLWENFLREKSRQDSSCTQLVPTGLSFHIPESGSESNGGPSLAFFQEKLGYAPDWNMAHARDAKRPPQPGGPPQLGGGREMPVVFLTFPRNSAPQPACDEAGAGTFPRESCGQDTYSSSGKIVFCLQWEAIAPIVQAEEALESSNGKAAAHIYLVQGGTIWPDGRLVDSSAIAALQHGQSGQGLYINHDGLPVVGAYTPLEDLGVGLLVEQDQADVLASSDIIAAASIALTLAVALTTTVIAAIVIRQITRPVIRLTESAVSMAEGDLDQHLRVTSRDEIGILTYVFNDMAAELKSLYDKLEAKVAERTKMLQRVNYQLQQRAIQLRGSQEVGNAIISVRDPERLLNRVVDLIRDRFLYASVAVYLLEPGGGEARLSALSPLGASWPESIHAGDGTVVERALRKREIQIVRQQTGEEVEWKRRTLTRVVVPLRMEERVLGALAVLSAEREGVPSDDLVVLELLTNQVAVALENARAYEREHLAAERMEEAEAFKARFLTNMSHELREPLNTIIGFSRLILKGLDGPLNQAMTQDLERIYGDGQHLLALVNDILATSEIQAGLLELQLRPIDLTEVVDGIMPTANALVRGKDIALLRDIETPLPLVRADPLRLRQILVHLLTNAAKFTNAGQIAIRAWYDEEQVYVSVSDTGIGIPPEDRNGFFQSARIFAKFEKPNMPASVRSAERRVQGAGLGLALAKEFVELHGGQIWVESEVGKGTTFTFSLSYYVDTESGTCRGLEDGTCQDEVGQSTEVGPGGSKGAEGGG